MLFGVLVLVLAAFGLLVTALVSATTWWAWASVAVSVLAAVALVVDWSRRRKANPAADAVPSRPSAEPATPAVEATIPDPDDEPAEEDTDAADLLVVTDLDTEVRVVDERPRYHLSSCAWLAARPTLGLPVREARELGFTPCAVCSPDRTLAADRRTDRRTTAEG